MSAKAVRRPRPDDELNVTQAAAYLGVPRTTLARLLELGLIPHTRLSERRPRVLVRDLDRYRASRTVKAAPTPPTQEKP